MARSLRVEYPGAVYHTMARGNNGQNIFAGSQGCRLFLATLEEACEQTGWNIHAYVLMPNHYHLLLETPEPNLVAGMKWFQGTYTQRFNLRFDRKGHLYQGRYKAIPVEAQSNEYFRIVSSYIHLNPFRAKLSDPASGNPLESYRWSSYPYYCLPSPSKPNWLVLDRVYSSWSFDPHRRNTPARYQTLHQQMMENSREEHDPREVQKQIQRGWYVGSDSFRDKLSTIMESQTDTDNLRGQQRRDHGVAEAERLLAKALEELQISENQLRERAGVDVEKQAVVWLIKTKTAVTGTWIAERLNMGHRVNVSRSLRRFREAETTETQALKQQMLQCSGFSEKKRQAPQ